MRSRSREKLTFESCVSLEGCPLGLLAFVHDLGVFSSGDRRGNKK
jgi:hypothetical protein